MGKKSRTNDHRAFFTSGERKKLRGYGTVSQRLLAHSKREFDSCCLCLQPSVDPMISPFGFLYCRKCIFENIISQRKKIKHVKKTERRKEKEKMKLLRKKKEQRVSEKKKVFEEKNSFVSGGNVNNAGVKEGIGGYWGTKTPEFEESKMVDEEVPKKKKRLKTVDPMCKKSLKFKSLVSVEFSVVVDREKSNARYKCPLCLKNFTQESSAAVLKDCGHCFCFGNCYKKFVMKDGSRCTVCSSIVKSTKDVIILKGSGTSFSSCKVGEAEVKVKKMDFRFG